MSAIKIRLASQQDLAAIVRCMAAAFAPYEASYTPGAWQDTVLTIEGAAQRLRDMTVLVAELPRAGIVGTIAYAAVRSGVAHDASHSGPQAGHCQLPTGEYLEGHLRGMAVDPAHHGAGIAERLLRQAEGGLREAGCVRVTLDTTHPLRRAIRFYERSGYSATGVVRDFFGMPLVEYEKRLA